MWYEYLVLGLPEDLLASTVEGTDNTFTLAIWPDENDDSFVEANDEEYYTIVYTLKSDTTIIFYNDDCNERDFEESVAMTGIQSTVYNFVNNIVGVVGLGCAWDGTFNNYMENYQGYTEMIVCGTGLTVYVVGGATAALFWDNLPLEWQTLMMAVPGNFDPDAPFANW